MKKNEIQIGQTYAVRVSGKVVPVRIEHGDYLGKGWWLGRNKFTGRSVIIRSAQRCREKVPVVYGPTGVEMFLRGAWDEIRARCEKMYGFTPAQEGGAL